MNIKINRQILILIIIAGLIGGIFGSMVDAPSAKANLFNDIYQEYLKPLFSGAINATSTAGENGAGLSEEVPLYGPTVDYEEAVIKAVEQSSPAVISIIISKYLPVIEQCPYNPFGNLPQDFQNLFGQDFQFYQPCQKGTELQEIGGGSGFVISSDGLIVTNRHVVADTEALYTVLTNDGKKYDAKVLARDSIRDLAVIKISADNLPVLKLGNSDSIKLGQTAIAIGNALGEFRNTVSVGVVSGLARNITASDASSGTVEDIEGLIQTDAAINSGNSGGPLLNLKGEVIGINVAVVSGAQNIGFAIPINQVRNSIESVRNTGHISTPYLGVRYTLIDSDLSKQEELPVEYGALVRGSDDGPAVLKNSPAEKSGLKPEDIILEINNEKVTADNSLSYLVQKYGVGDILDLKVLRNNEEIILRATLEERPENL